MRLKRAMIGILTFVLLAGTIAIVPASKVSAAGRAKISAKNLALNPGAARTLTVSGASGNVKWSTSNKKVVSIKKNGNKATVTAKKKGTATVTARIGKNKLPCKVRVSEKKILIAYFSRTGNSRKVAKYIQKSIGGDLVQIKTKKAYPSDYDRCVSQAEKELEDDIRPQITTRVKNFAQYDEVVIGYPNWWASIPMPITSFLEEYDFSGKTIIPFCSHGGGRFGQSLTAIAKLVPDAKMGEALSVHYSGGSDLPDEITEWLKTNGIIE